MTVAERRWGPVELLTLQATPFCNIDCEYCYLPHRSDTRRMQPQTASAVIRHILDSQFLNHGDELEINWHAGEPLAVPPSHYERLFDAIESENRGRIEISQSVQTNATLISQPWCDFFRERKVTVGVSVDGPAFVHDARRKGRSGAGTHADVIKGLSLLRQNEIPFACVAVVSRDSMFFPDEIIDFFEEQEIYNIGFNREEIVGSNRRTSLVPQDEEFLRTFMARVYHRVQPLLSKLSNKPVKRH